MSNNFFNRLVEKLIVLEGGYVNNPSDAGGETKYGISKRSYPNVDIKNLSTQQAADIYYDDFWVKNNLDKIEDYDLAWAIFKAVVVTNPLRVISILQAENNAINLKQLAIDGRLGEKTLAAVNQLSPQWAGILKNLFEYRLSQYYTCLVLKDNSQKIFLLGWLNRVFFK